MQKRSKRKRRGIQSQQDNALYLDEPLLEFGVDRYATDPRDGLSLFGPLDVATQGKISWAAIGPERALGWLSQWVKGLQGPSKDTWVDTVGGDPARPLFPGFQAAFGAPIDSDPLFTRTLDDEELRHRYLLDDPHQRVFQTVKYYEEAILGARREEEAQPLVWIVVIPDDLYRYCRPKSEVPKRISTKSSISLSEKYVAERMDSKILFPDERQDFEPYTYEVDFHNQLKAKLLGTGVAVQIVRECTIVPDEEIGESYTPFADPSKSRGAIAWNLSSAMYYKSGARPWKLHKIRGGVAYTGLAFKRMHGVGQGSTACCGAQLFLDSGDGLVFRGAVGPWWNSVSKEYHLSEEAAEDLLRRVIQAYRRKHNDEYPKEAFVHASAAFTDAEWNGFCKAVDSTPTEVVGVRIRDEKDVRLYTQYDWPVIRGVVVPKSRTSCFLWSRGFIPRLGTYPGREVPTPLRIDVVRGRADIDTVARDVLALTKLNYNSCNFADGVPVTLRFADAVGEILTAGPTISERPQPFRYYI